MYGGTPVTLLGRLAAYGTVQCRSATIRPSTRRTGTRNCRRSLGDRGGGARPTSATARRILSRPDRSVPGGDRAGRDGRWPDHADGRRGRVWRQRAALDPQPRRFLYQHPCYGKDRLDGYALATARAALSNYLSVNNVNLTRFDVNANEGSRPTSRARRSTPPRPPSSTCRPTSRCESMRGARASSSTRRGRKLSTPQGIRCIRRMA